MKNIKKSENEEMNKKREKNGIKKVEKKKKRGPKGGGVPRDGPKKLIFHIRIDKRNRNEIEAPKNQILSTQQRR